MGLRTVSDTNPLYFYLGTFLALVAAGLGAPIPEELPIVFAGAAVGHAAEDPPPQLPPEMLWIFDVAPDLPFPATIPWTALVKNSEPLPPAPPAQQMRLKWWIMLPVCILGVVLSDMLLYCVGRFGGRRLLHNRWLSRLLPPNKLEHIEENFRKYGVWALLFARFLPAIRSPIFITAGIMRLSIARFLLADGIYAIPGVSLLFWLAFWFGDQFRDLVERAEQKVERIRPLLILLLIAGVAGFLLYHFLRKPVASGDPQEMPLIGDKVAAKIEHPHEPASDHPPGVNSVLDGKSQPEPRRQDSLRNQE